MTVRFTSAALVVLSAVALAACGGSGDKAGKDETVGPTPNPADFPSTKGKSMLQIYRSLGGGGGPVLAPTVESLLPGKNRYGFALFTAARKQIGGVPVALYVQRQGQRKTAGPFVARDLKLAVAPAYRSETVAQDPDAAKSLYVAKLPFGKPGTYAVMAVAKLDGRLVPTNPTRADVLANDPVPHVGEKAPVIDTPTVESVGGDVEAVETRKPPDDMHEVNFRDVVGKKPIVLVFATPALCQSRVCGPVVDIEQQLKAETKEDVAFIHMEVYRDNTIKPGCLENTRPPSECLRPQFLAYNLRTEPWAFTIDRHGKVAARLEGAYSMGELEHALKAAVHP
jgi:hypothetical protein